MTTMTCRHNAAYGLLRLCSSAAGKSLAAVPVVHTGGVSDLRDHRRVDACAIHAWRPVDPQMSFSDEFTDSYGICLPPYQNTIGEREPSIWAGPPEPNFHSYGGWCPVSYGILVGG